MKAGQVDAWLGHQGSQPGHEVQGVEDDMGGAVPVRCLQLVADVAVGGEGEPLFRDCRAGDVSAQPLQLSSLVRLCCDTGMEREARFLGQPSVLLGFLPRGDRL